MTDWAIIPFHDDDFGTDPIAVVEATNKSSALAGAAKGLGGVVTQIGGYQVNRPVLWLDRKPHFWTAVRR